MRNRFLCLIIVLGTVSVFAFTACSEKKTDKYVILTTTLGNIKIELSDSTPLHKSNFIKLVRSGYYDGILFHRVINNFMIQAGDVATRVPQPASGIDTLSSYTIPAEIIPSLFHHKGAVAAARMGNDVNPEMRSSGTQFYIVQGQLMNDQELDQAEERINRSLNQLLYIRTFRNLEDSIKKTGTILSDQELQEMVSLKLYSQFSVTTPYVIPAWQKEVYKTRGGVPRLDQTYTVFGKVVEGIEIVDKIASVPTDNRDKPIEDIRIIKAIISDK